MAVKACVWGRRRVAVVGLHAEAEYTDSNMGLLGDDATFGCYVPFQFESMLAVARMA